MVSFPVAFGPDAQGRAIDEAQHPSRFLCENELADACIYRQQAPQCERKYRPSRAKVARPSLATCACS